LGGPDQLRIRASISERIIEEVRRAHQERPLDLFLSYFYNAHFDPASFDEIHRLGIPTVNFYCNSIFQFDLVADIAAKVRFSWHAEKHARESYLRVGANPIWVQMGADPELYRPIEIGTRKPEACFVGQRYADRDRWISALIRASVPIAVFGSGWGTDPSLQYTPVQSASRFGSYLKVAVENLRQYGLVGGTRRIWARATACREARRLAHLIKPHARGSVSYIAPTFAQYAVVLNFSNVWADGLPGSALIPHVRLRDFEGPMCRACYLTGHTDEIGEFYEVGREIDTYRTQEELVDKTRYYLTHPEAAEKLREAGYQRALRDHTWTRRFQELFQKIRAT
jgi:hypothetical protein